MHGARLALMSCLLVASCGPVDAGVAESAEEIGGQLDEPGRSPMGIDHPTPEAKAIRIDRVTEAQIEESLSAWRVYRTQRAPFDRAEVFVALEDKDARNVPSWVYLDLREHWLHGDSYLEETMKKHHLTVLDMVGILAAIQQAGDKLPPLASRPLSTTLPELDCVECDPHGTPWIPPGPDADHRGGPPPTGGAPPPSGGTHPGGPHHGGGVSPGGSTGPTPEEARAMHDWSNGLRKGDPPARPSPMDATYQPKPGEQKETFKCEGQVYHGYKNGCIDFEKLGTGPKWYVKGWSWLGRVIDKLDDAEWELQHRYLWKSGLVTCSTKCAVASASICAVDAAALAVICAEVPACITRISGLAANLVTKYPVLQQELVELTNSAAGPLPPLTLCTVVLQDTCVRNQCGN
jgi:hypothetical protein